MTYIKSLIFTVSLLCFNAFAQLPDQVVLYSTSWCPYCQQAKAYFESLGVAYTDNDIENSPQAREAYKSLNGNGIPLVFIGNTRFDGYDPEGFEQALMQSGLIKPDTNAMSS